MNEQEKDFRVEQINCQICDRRYRITIRKGDTTYNIFYICDNCLINPYAANLYVKNYISDI